VHVLEAGGVRQLLAPHPALRMRCHESIAQVQCHMIYSPIPVSVVSNDISSGQL